MTDLGMPRLRRAPDAPAGTDGLVDRFGRIARDLRVSLTDKCNLRCTYCMPAEGMPWLPRAALLTDDEVVRLVRVFVALGVEQVRFTGGEPLLRPGLADVLRRVAEIAPRPRTALTTNGIGLDKVAARLADAGLDRVNVSLDSVDREDFAALTRRDRLPQVLDGIAAAVRAGLTPVKINAVVMRGINDGGVPNLLQWCLDRGLQLRFIEQMPLDAGHEWRADRLVSRAEILDRLSMRFDLTPLPSSARGSAPAELFCVDGGPATVGVIPSVTAPFCAACDRVRLTADGQVRNCLFAHSESDLRGPLREGASDEDLARIIRGEMWRKERGHEIGLAGFHQPDRAMSAIGG
ncbi:Molybdenum cofactor biosynthesis protein A [Nostocoides japonicum T1-X7]|uniref:GTP 3',8-cyclase n=1 Tax=Nostocoides japonicum T1-X7 TaxID=1194083 RepID=A0A077M0D3_9MICO|nr:GTP 3',8-cyclase MoaA [Tetrasphaera japonica]CCH79718.1 Molybdenum cofactor biosynthesis protein A [Tetrasphaera japonica T1-X7]